MKAGKISILFFILLFFGYSRNSNDSLAKESSNPGNFKLLSPAFHHGKRIPRKYTCQGRDISLPLSWCNPPAGTKSFALIMDDPDARPVVGYTWVHWVIYNISSSVNSLPEKLSRSSVIKLNTGMKITQGNTSWKRPGYGGPCPPKGTGIHRYIFKLYALKDNLNLPAGLTKAKLLKAIKSSIIAETTLVGNYIQKR